jgi:Flp pilus assembly protein TadB
LQTLLYFRYEFRYCWRRNNSWWNFCSFRCESIHGRTRNLVLAVILFIGLLITVIINMVTGLPHLYVLIPIVIGLGLLVAYLSVSSYMGNKWYKEGG